MSIEKDNGLNPELFKSFGDNFSLNHFSVVKEVGQPPRVQVTIPLSAEPLLEQLLCQSTELHQQSGILVQELDSSINRLVRENRLSEKAEISLRESPDIVASFSYYEGLREESRTQLKTLLLVTVHYLVITAFYGAFRRTTSEGRKLPSEITTIEKLLRITEYESPPFVLVDQKGEVIKLV